MTEKSLRIGTDQGKVIIAVGDTPIAALDAPQAATLAALIIKHACILASGLSPKVVEQATKEIYDEKRPV